MDKGYREWSCGECVSEHTTLGCPQHASSWVKGQNQEIVEVCPPKEVVHGARTGCEAGDRELFPVVSAAHECKTPLVVMLGYADLLRSGRFGPVNEEQLRMLGEIQQSGERLRKFTEDLMLLYRLQSADGASIGSRPKTDVNEALLGIFNYWAPLATLKSIAYDFLAAPGDPRVAADPLKLQLIVSNLIENALNYTPVNGEVVISATPCFWERRKIQQTEFLFNFERRVNRKIANSVHICVSDSGPGIPPEHHEEIFKDFVRSPDASSRGTGLGLAIARRLALADGGAVWVESEPGTGSRFSLLFAQTG